MLWSECKPVDVLWEKLYVTSAEMLFVVVLMERKPMRGHCQLKMFGGEGGGVFLRRATQCSTRPTIEFHQKYSLIKLDSTEAWASHQ